MAAIEPGKIVLFRFPQTDLEVGKMRPALLLAKVPSSYDDWLVCMMSSQTQQEISGMDELISAIDEDFLPSGLKSDTVIRLTRIAVVSATIFAGTIGEISIERLERLKRGLAKWIENS